MRKKNRHPVIEFLEARRLLTLSTGLISGTVFKDVNQDGVYDKGDLLVAKRTLYIATSPSKFVKGDATAITNSTGAFSFIGLKAGTYYVYDENPAGTAIIDPSATYYKVTLSATAPKASVTFGEITLPFTHGIITGTLFYDAAGSGVYKATDPPVAGRTLYIDLTDKGSYVAGDPKAITNSKGVFTFSDLKVGTYIIRDEVPAGRVVDDPIAGYVKATVSVAVPKPTVLMGEKPVPTLNFVGEYEQYYEGQLIVVDVRPVGTTLGSYTGDIVTNGDDLKFTGTESPANIISGDVATPKGPIAFSAALSSKTITVTYPTMAGVKDILTRVSKTPAPPPPTLFSFKGSIFDYVKPENWTAVENDEGIVISSPDRTEQVGFLGTVAVGDFGVDVVAESEVKSGATFISSKLLLNKSLSTTEYVQAAEATLTFKHDGTTYASAQLIETYNFALGGGKVETVTMIYEVTTPLSQFAADSPTLIYMLSQIKLTSAAIAVKAIEEITHHQFGSSSGFYDPGVSGDWSSGGGVFAGNSELEAEQSSLAYSSSQFDQENDQFDQYILGSSGGGGSAGSAAIHRPTTPPKESAARRGAVSVGAGKLQIGKTTAPSTVTHSSVVKTSAASVASRKSK